MKQPTNIEFVDVQRTTEWRLVETAWEPRKDFRYKWMVRLVSWFFRRFGKEHFGAFDVVTRHSIDTVATIENIMKQRSALVANGFEPELLLIGNSDYAELMSQREILSYIEFDCEYRVGHIDDCGRNQVKFANLAVRVVPWMKGCLVLDQKPIRLRERAPR